MKNNMIKLNQCECQFDYPISITKKKINIKKLKIYSSNEVLKKAIAKRHGVKESQVILTSGALNALKIILKNKKILLPDFSWKQYQSIAKENNSSLVSFKVVECNSEFNY